MAKTAKNQLALDRETERENQARQLEHTPPEPEPAREVKQPHPSPEPVKPRF